MKVLYLDHPENDYLATIVYLGLCQELGSENVVDWPWQPTYHGENYQGPIPYGPNARGEAEPFCWMPAQPGRSWSDKEVEQKIDGFELVILASPRAYNTQRLRDLIARVGRQTFRQLVMLDGEDYTAVRWDLVREFEPSVYFKLSHVPEPLEIYPRQRDRMQNRTRVVSCPLATTFQNVALTEKKIDVCFLGGTFWRGPRHEGVPETREPLKPAIEHLLREKLSGFNVVCGNLPYEEYRAALAASRIALCVSGHGLEPMRTFEAMSCPETLVLREPLPQMTPWPIECRETCACFNSPEEIPDVCRYWLGREDERREIAIRGNVLALAHYTPRARARQILFEALS